MQSKKDFLILYTFLRARLNCLGLLKNLVDYTKLSYFLAHMACVSGRCRIKYVSGVSNPGYLSYTCRVEKTFLICYTFPPSLFKFFVAELNLYPWYPALLILATHAEQKRINLVLIFFFINYILVQNVDVCNITKVIGSYLFLFFS